MAGGGTRRGLGVGALLLPPRMARRARAPARSAAPRVGPVPAEPADHERGQVLHLRALGEALRDAQDAEAAARAALYAAVRAYVDGGGSQSRAAKEAGIDRMTVRKIVKP